MTYEEFLLKLYDKHNGKYCVTPFVYKNMYTIITVKCLEHNIEHRTNVRQVLNGDVCKKCVSDKRKGRFKVSVNEFIERSNKIHNFKYDYSRCDYQGINSKITIICPIHGEFRQKCANHLYNKRGCPKCKGGVKSTTEEFIEKAKQVHGDKYDYSKVYYKNNVTKVCIICPKHGDMLQTPSNHLQGGCRKCADEMLSNNKKIGLRGFIEESKLAWGVEVFNYDKVTFNFIHEKVKIVCNKHNLEFEQIAQSHIKGNISCPKCYEEKYGRKPDNYWTYERCYEEAKKYEWLSDFEKNVKYGYIISIRKGWIKKFTWLKRTYNKTDNILTCKRHLIYMYFFHNKKAVYVGLTCNLEKRDKEHRSDKFNSSVRIFCMENNLQIPKPVIIEDKLTLLEAPEREKYWIRYYNDSGYLLINRTKGGEMGFLSTVIKQIKL